MPVAASVIAVVVPFNWLLVTMQSSEPASKWIPVAAEIVLPWRIPSSEFDVAKIPITVVSSILLFETVNRGHASNWIPSPAWSEILHPVI